MSRLVFKTVGKRWALTKGNYTAITVRQLIASLKEVNPDAWVLTAIDAEGNGYNLIGASESDGYLTHVVVKPNEPMREVESAEEGNAIILQNIDGRQEKELDWDFSDLESETSAKKGA
jgi:hypothetical protein